MKLLFLALNVIGVLVCLNKRQRWSWSKTPVDSSEKKTYFQHKTLRMFWSNMRWEYEPDKRKFFSKRCRFRKEWGFYVTKHISNMTCLLHKLILEELFASLFVKGFLATEHHACTLTMRLQRRFVQCKIVWCVRYNSLCRRKSGLVNWPARVCDGKLVEIFCDSCKHERWRMTICCYKVL